MLLNLFGYNQKHQGESREGIAMVPFKWIPSVLAGKIMKIKSFILVTCILSLTMLGGSFLFIEPVYSLPSGEQVEAGQATFERPNESTLNVTASDQVIINWSNFNIAAHETVNFSQPFSTSMALNRVLGGGATEIAGSLNANGMIVLINPNGINISQTANINVASLVASSLNISNDDFMAKNFNFVKADDLPAGLVINKGNIQIAEGGIAALFGSQVSNEGKIVAQKGAIVLASGNKITLTFGGIGRGGLVSVVVAEGVSLNPQTEGMSNAVANSGELSAAGGKIILTAKQVNDVFDLLVNQSGIIKANSAIEVNGIIELIAINGNLRISGLVEVNGMPENPNAGRIYMQGTDVSMTGSVSAKPEHGGSAGEVAIHADDDIEMSGSAGNAEIEVGGDWVGTGLFEPDTSTVTFMDASQPSYIYGSNTFYNLRSVTPDKELNFEAGATQTVLGAFEITGAVGHPVYIRSTDRGGVQWKLNPMGTNSVSYVFIGDTWNLASEEMKTLPSNSYGNNTGIDTDPIWNGQGTTNNWSEGANWDTGVAPINTDTVTFNGTTGTNPNKDATVDAGWNAANSTVANLTITSGYSGTITLAKTLIVTTAYSQAGGTFDAAGQTFDLNGTYSLTGGTFTASSGNMFSAGNFTISAGTFNHNSGTLTFDGGSATINVVAGTNFNHVIIDSNTTKSITNSFNVLGNLTKQNSGTTQATGATDPTITLSGNFSMSGTGAFGSNSTSNDLLLTFAGSTSHNITISAGTFQAKLSIPSAETLTMQTALNSAYSQAGGGGNDALTLNGTLDTNTFVLTLAGAYVQNSGTFTGSSGAHDFNSSFTLAGGTFNASSATMTFAANFTISAGTFTHNSSTISFDSSSAGTINVVAGTNFNHVIFNSSQTKSITNSFNVLGDLTRLNTGTVQATGATDPTITLSGNFSMSGNGTLGSNSTTNDIILTFAGSTNHNMTLSAGTFQPKVVVPSGETLTMLTALNSAYSQASNDAFTVSGGTVETNGFVLTLAGSYLQSSGTFNGSTAAHDFNGAWTLSGGTFNASSATMTFAANFTFSGGTFNANSSTVTFDGGNGTLTLGGIGFHHLIFNSNSTKSLTGSATIAGNLTVQGAGSVTELAAATPSLSLSGNYSQTNGTFGFTNVTLKAVGNTSHNFSVTAGTFQPKWVMDSALDTVVITSSTISLSSPGTFTISAGTLDINTHTFDLNNTFVMSGGLIYDSVGGGQFLMSSAMTQSGGEIRFMNSDASGNQTLTQTGGFIVDLTFSHTSGTRTLAVSANKFLVTGNLTKLNNGIVSSNSAVTLELTGNFSMTTATAGTWGNANLSLSGTAAAHNYSQSSGSFDGILLIDDIGESFTLTTGFTGGANGVINIQNGQLSTGSNAIVLTNSFLQSGGTFNGGSGAHDYNGLFQLSGGTHNASSAISTYAGNFTISAGSFVHNSGTTTFDGGAATINVVAGTQFNHVTFANTSTKSITNSFVVLGNLSIQGTNTVQASGATDPTLTVNGNISQTGSGTFGNSTASNDFIVNFAGSTNHNISKSAGTFSAKMHLDNVNETVTMTSNFTFDYNVSGAGLEALVISASGSVFDTNGFVLNMAQSSSNFSQTGGTFEGRGGAHDFNGSWSQSGGTYNASTAVTTYSNNFTFSGGTFTHNSGTTTFDNSSATLTMGGVPLYHTIFNHTSTKSIAGNFSAQDITKSGAGTVNHSGASTPVITMAGNFSISTGTFGDANFTLDVSGPTAHSFTQTGGTFAVNSWHLDAAEDVVTLASNFTHNSGTLNINGGTFDTNDFILTHNGSYSQTAGTFEGKSGAHDFNGSWSLSGGDFNASSGTMTFASTFTISGGNFNAGPTGTVTFDGSGATLTMGGATFHHVIFNFTSTKSLSGNFSTTGDITKQNVGALSHLSGNPVITLGGNFTLSSGTFGSANITMEVSGSTAHNFNQTGGTFAINSLHLDAAEDSIIMTSNFTHNTGTLDLDNGSFDTNGFVLTHNGTYDQTGGTFEGRNGAHDFNGLFQMSGGTFNASSATTTFSSTFTVTGGTFNGGSGSSTVIFDNSSATLTMGGVTFNHVTFNHSGTKSISGNFSTTGNIIKQGNGAVSHLTGQTPVVTLGGDFSISLGTFGSTSMTMEFTSAAHSMSQTGGTFNMNLELDNAGDQVNLGTNFTISSGTTSLIAGTFDTATFVLTHNGTYNQTGGTFNSNAGAQDFNGSWSQSAGDFNASSGTMTFASNFTYSGGNFITNSGTVNFDGGNATLTMGDIVFNHLIFTPTSGTKSISGNFSTVGDITKNGNGGISQLNSELVTMTLGGNFSLTQGSFGSSNMTLEFAGSSAHSLSITGGNFNMNIELDAAEDDVDLATNFTMNNGSSVFNIIDGSFGNGAFLFTDNGPYTQSGGSFNAGSGNLDFNSTFTLSGGTFNASPNTTFFSSNYTRTGGTFSAGTGTVNFDGFGTLDPGGSTFNHVIFSGSYQISSNLTILGNLTKSTFNSINSTFAMTPTITLYGDFTFTEFSSFGDSNMTVIPTGGTNHNFSNTDGGTFYAILSISNPGTTVTLTTDWTISSPGRFVLSGAGSVLDVGTHTLILQDLFTISNGTVQVNAGSGGILRLEAALNQSGGVIDNINLNAINQTLTQTGGSIGNASFIHVGGNTFLAVSGNDFLITGNLTQSGAGSVISNGSAVNVRVLGDFSQTAGLFGDVNMTLVAGGNAVQNFSTTGATFNPHLKVDKTGGVFQLMTPLVMASTRNVTIQAGALSLNGQDWTMNSGTFSNDGTLQLQGAETITGLAQDTDSGTWKYVGNGDSTADTYTVKDWGATDYFNLTIGSADAVDVFQPTAALVLANTYQQTGGIFSQNGQPVSVNGATTFILDSGVYNQTAALNVTGDMQINGGTFNGSNSSFAIDVNGSFLQTGGSFTATNGTMTVEDNFSHTAGTFTHNSGNVVLDGADQTITGDTTFYNLTKTASVVRTLTFAAGSTQIVQNLLTLQGAAGQILLLRSSVNGSQWNINPQTNVDISYVDVKDSVNLNPLPINPSKSVDSGNNVNWYAPILVSISGTAYSDLGVTPLVGADVILIIDGVQVAGPVQTAAVTGAYTFLSVSLQADNVILVVISGNAVKGNAQGLTSRFNISGLDVYAGELKLNGTVINADLSQAKGALSNSDILYSVSSGNLTMNSAGIIVTSGSLYTPGGNVDTGDLIINGTMNKGANDVIVRGNWDSTGGSFISSGGTLTFNSTGSHTINTGGAAFTPAVTFTGAGGTWTALNNMTFSAAVTISSSVTLAAGTNTLTFSSTLSIGANNLTLRADGIDFTGGANSVAGTGIINLEPSLAGGSIGIAGAAGTLQLSSADIAALANGFAGIVIGRTDGSGAITMNAVTFVDPVTFKTPQTGGSITIDGLLTGTGNASITILGSGSTTNLNANIVTSGGEVTVQDLINAVNASLTIDTTNGGSVPTGADVTVGEIVSAVNSSLTIRAGTAGDVTTNGRVGTNSQPLNNFTITSANVVQMYNSAQTATVSVASVGNIQIGGNITTSGNSTFTSSTGEFSAMSATSPVILSTAGNVSVTAASVNTSVNAGVLTLQADSSSKQVTVNATAGSVGTATNPVRERAGKLSDLSLEDLFIFAVTGGIPSTDVTTNSGGDTTVTSTDADVHLVLTSATALGNITVATTGASSTATVQSAIAIGVDMTAPTVTLGNSSQKGTITAEGTTSVSGTNFVVAAGGGNITSATFVRSTGITELVGDLTIVAGSGGVTIGDVKGPGGLFVSSTGNFDAGNVGAITPASYFYAVVGGQSTIENVSTQTGGSGTLVVTNTATSSTIRYPGDPGNPTATVDPTGNSTLAGAVIVASQDASNFLVLGVYRDGNLVQEITTTYKITPYQLSAIADGSGTVRLFVSGMETVGPSQFEGVAMAFDTSLGEIWKKQINLVSGSGFTYAYRLTGNSNNNSIYVVANSAGTSVSSQVRQYNMSDGTLGNTITYSTGSGATYYSIYYEPTSDQVFATGFIQFVHSASVPAGSVGVVRYSPTLTFTAGDVKSISWTGGGISGTEGAVLGPATPGDAITLFATGFPLSGAIKAGATKFSNSTYSSIPSITTFATGVETYSYLVYGSSYYVQTDFTTTSSFSGTKIYQLDSNFTSLGVSQIGTDDKENCPRILLNLNGSFVNVGKSFVTATTNPIIKLDYVTPVSADTTTLVGSGTLSGDTYDTGIAIANTSDTAAEITVSLTSATGVTFTKDVTVGTNAKLQGNGTTVTLSATNTINGILDNSAGSTNISGTKITTGIKGVALLGNTTLTTDYTLDGTGYITANDFTYTTSGKTLLINPTLKYFAINNSATFNGVSINSTSAPTKELLIFIKPTLVTGTNTTISNTQNDAGVPPFTAGVNGMVDGGGNVNVFKQAALTTGVTLAGTARNTSGAVLPNAQINVAIKGVQYTTTTGVAGDYSINIPAGVEGGADAVISVTSVGFKPGIVKTTLPADGQTKIGLDVKLQVGQLAQTEVATDTELIDAIGSLSSTTQNFGYEYSGGKTTLDSGIDWKVGIGTDWKVYGKFEYGGNYTNEGTADYASSSETTFKGNYLSTGTTNWNVEAKVSYVYPGTGTQTVQGNNEEFQHVVYDTNGYSTSSWGISGVLKYKSLGFTASLSSDVYNYSTDKVEADSLNTGIGDARFFFSDYFKINGLALGNGIFRMHQFSNQTLRLGGTQGVGEAYISDSTYGKFNGSWSSMTFGLPGNGTTMINNLGLSFRYDTKMFGVTYKNDSPVVAEGSFEVQATTAELNQDMRSAGKLGLSISATWDTTKTLLTLESENDRVEITGTGDGNGNDVSILSSLGWEIGEMVDWGSITASASNGDGTANGSVAANSGNFSASTFLALSGLSWGFTGGLTLTAPLIKYDVDDLSTGTGATLNGYVDWTNRLSLRTVIGGYEMNAGADMTGVTKISSSGGDWRMLGAAYTYKLPLTLEVKGNYRNEGSIVHNNGTIQIAGTANQDVYSGGSSRLYNKIEFTAQLDAYIREDITVDQFINYLKDIYQMNGADIHVTGNMENNGGSFNGSTNSDSIDVDGNFIQTGGAVTLTNGTTTIGGNINRTGGTLAHGGGTVVLDGGNQTFTGSSTLNNFIKNVSSAATLTFAAGSTTTIAGILDLQGTSGNLLSLRSSSSGTAWNINPQGTRTLAYLDVKDSNNTNGTQIDAQGTSSVDSGGNSGWIFDGGTTATHLSFGTQPVNTVYGDAITVTVEVLDSSNALVTTGSFEVTLSIGNNPGSGVLSGTLSVTSVNGVATFTDLTISKVGTGYTLDAMATGLTGASSNSFDITQRALTITATGVNKVYDGSTAATVNLSDNRVSGDVFTTSYTSAVFDDKNVGSGKTVSVSGISISGADAGNYTFNASATTTANITPKALTVSAAGVNKVYDATTAATVNLSDDRISGDVFTTSSTSASFADKNVGNGKTVSVSGIGISGTDAGNYTFNTSTTTTANITPKSLTISASGVNKVYDGTTAATVNLSDNRISGDVFTTSYSSASFADKNVGNGKTVSVSGIGISGTDAGNYTFNTSTTTTANITPKSLTISASGVNRVYDGTADATVNLSDNRVSGDVFTTSYTSAVFDDKNVGNGKTVSVSGIGISGTDAGNYTFNTSTTTTANITPYALTVSATGIDKVYDGTTAATVNLSDDRISGDVFTTSYTSAEFADANVGTGITVTVNGISISGTDAGNYTFNTSTTTTADILAGTTATQLSFGTQPVNTVYGNTITLTVELLDSGSVLVTAGSALVTISIGNNPSGGVLSGTLSVISVNGVATFNDLKISKVGTGYTLDASATGLTGATSNSFDITQRALTITASGINKVYDATDVATVNLSDNRIAGDVFTASYTSAVFDDKNVGTGKTVSVSGIGISGADAGNYTFNTTATTSANITPYALTISATGGDKTYDSTDVATVNLTDDRFAGDVFTASYTSAVFDDKNVGTGKTISVSGISISGTDAGNYTFNTDTTTTANITPYALTITASGVNKVYDATTAATVNLSDDRFAGDVFTDSYTSATFANKNVGNGKTVSVSGISISGTDAGNYTFNTTATTSADITPYALTISASGVNKVYDATTAATVNLIDDRFAGDDLSTSYTSATFANKNVGNGKTVSVSGISVSGVDASNYTYNTSATTTANITPFALTISASGNNKVYDATTAATVNLSDNRFAGDVFTNSYTSATFANKNVGNGKTVSVSGISISGTDAGNYTFNTTASTTANITPFALTITAAGVNKVYDGTDVATVNLSDDRFAGDVFTANYTSAVYPDKNVGTGKTISISGISISGTDAGNYTFNTTATASADITPYALTISASGVNKVYDATDVATVNLSDDRIAGDLLTTGYTTAVFDNKNAGTGKTVTVIGISLSGADASNYTFNTSTTTTANITPRSLAVSAVGVDKIYDATDAATVNLSDNRIAGDVFTASYTSATFDDKNVGTGKTVTVNGIALSGTDAGNYSPNTSTTTTANITPFTLTISAVGVDKVYDSTTAATVNLSDDRFAGDVFTASYTSATFANKNVGNSKTVSVSGISISGTDTGNYTFNTTTTTTANITPFSLTVSATGVNKVYDATTAATVNLADDRFAGDVISDSYTSAAFANKNVGNGKTVSVSGISISGTDAGNYTFNNSATTTANITPFTLTITASGVDKVYDATTSATVNLTDDRFAGDAFSSSYTASYSDKNVGSAKTVSVSSISLSGTDAGNYTYNTSATTTADITPFALTISATGVNRVYDSTTAATVNLTDDRFAGDVFTASYTSAVFADKNVGTGKTVSVSGVSISGTDAGNYTFNTTATASANITPFGLTITAAGVNKVYDSTTAATVNLSDNRFAGDVFTDSYMSATFANKNVGNGKIVSVSGISISGTDAGNYTFNTTATSSANITPFALTISASGVNKVYDGTTAATVNLLDDRFSGDIFTDSYTSATFPDKNVGIAKTISVSGISISGTDAGNYTFNTTATTAANITPRALTISATGINKVYDATVAATVNLSDNRIAGDILATNYTGASFANKNVGTGKTVSVSGILLTGADSGNYTFNTSTTTTANITPLAITISATGVDKAYDGNTSATVNLTDNRIAGDVFTASYTNAAFADKHLGTAKTVTVSGISLSGADSGNYTFNASTTTTADINTPRVLTISAAGVDKVFDGTTAATVNLSDDRIAGDALSTNYTSATFADPALGTGKTVTVTGISLSGADAGNYTFNTSTITTASIISPSAAGSSAIGEGLIKDFVSKQIFAATKEFYFNQADLSGVDQYYESADRKLVNSEMTRKKKLPRELKYPKIGR